jgi:hypothetical protein
MNPKLKGNPALRKLRKYDHAAMREKYNRIAEKRRWKRSFGEWLNMAKAAGQSQRWDEIRFKTKGLPDRFRDYFMLVFENQINKLTIARNRAIKAKEQEKRKELAHKGRWDLIQDMDFTQSKEYPSWNDNSNNLPRY